MNGVVAVMIFMKMEKVWKERLCIRAEKPVRGIFIKKVFAL